MRFTFLLSSLCFGIHLVAGIDPAWYRVSSTGDHAVDVANRIQELEAIMKLPDYKFPMIHPLDLVEWRIRMNYNIQSVILYYQGGGGLPGPSDYLYAYRDYMDHSIDKLERRTKCPIAFEAYGWVEYVCSPRRPQFFAMDMSADLVIVIGPR
jgi:hypothetical protein